MFRRLLSLNSLYLWPLRLCRPSLRVKNFALSIDSLPDRILYVSIRSPRCFLFSSVRSNRWIRSLYVKCLNSGTSFVALIWIRSRVLMSFLKWGDQTCTQYLNNSFNVGPRDCRWALTVLTAITRRRQHGEDSGEGIKIICCYNYN